VVRRYHALLSSGLLLDHEQHWSNPKVAAHTSKSSQLHSSLADRLMASDMASEFFSQDHTSGS